MLGVKLRLESRSHACIVLHIRGRCVLHSAPRLERRLICMHHAADPRLRAPATTTAKAKRPQHRALGEVLEQTQHTWRRSQRAAPLAGSRVWVHVIEEKVEVAHSYAHQVDRG